MKGKKLSSSEKSNLIHFIKMKNSYWMLSFRAHEKKDGRAKKKDEKKGKEFFFFLWEVAKLKEIFFSFIIIFIHNIIFFLFLFREWEYRLGFTYIHISFHHHHLHLKIKKRKKNIIFILHVYFKIIISTLIRSTPHL